MWDHAAFPGADAGEGLPALWPGLRPVLTVRRFKCIARELYQLIATTNDLELAA